MEQIIIWLNDSITIREDQHDFWLDKIIKESEGNPFTIQSWLLKQVDQQSLIYRTVGHIQKLSHHDGSLLGKRLRGRANPRRRATFS